MAVTGLIGIAPAVMRSDVISFILKLSGCFSPSAALLTPDGACGGGDHA
jgi:hypothetical protein